MTMSSPPASTPSSPSTGTPGQPPPSFEILRSIFFRQNLLLSSEVNSVRDLATDLQYETCKLLDLSWRNLLSSARLESSSSVTTAGGINSPWVAFEKECSQHLLPAPLVPGAAFPQPTENVTQSPHLLQDVATLLSETWRRPRLLAQALCLFSSDVQPTTIGDSVGGGSSSTPIDLDALVQATLFGLYGNFNPLVDERAILTVLEHILTYNFAEIMKPRSRASSSEIKASSPLTQAQMDDIRKRFLHWLRENSLFSRMLSSYLKYFTPGRAFLRAVLRAPLLKAISMAEKLNPSLQTPSADETANTWLVTACVEIFQAIEQNIPSLPFGLRWLCRRLIEIPSNGRVADGDFSLVSELLLSRFICPAIIQPQFFGILQDASLNAGALFGLKTLAKAVSAVAQSAQLESVTDIQNIHRDPKIATVITKIHTHPHFKPSFILNTMRQVVSVPDLPAGLPGLSKIDRTVSFADRVPGAATAAAISGTAGDQARLLSHELLEQPAFHLDGPLYMVTSHRICFILSNVLFRSSLTLPSKLRVAVDRLNGALDAANKALSFIIIHGGEPKQGRSILLDPQTAISLEMGEERLHQPSPTDKKAFENLSQHPRLGKLLSREDIAKVVEARAYLWNVLSSHSIPSRSWRYFNLNSILRQELAFAQASKGDAPAFSHFKYDFSEVDTDALTNAQLGIDEFDDDLMDGVMDYSSNAVPLREELIRIMDSITPGQMAEVEVWLRQTLFADYAKAASFVLLLYEKRSSLIVRLSMLKAENQKLTRSRRAAVRLHSILRVNRLVERRSAEIREFIKEFEATDNYENMPAVVTNFMFRSEALLRQDQAWQTSCQQERENACLILERVFMQKVYPSVFRAISSTSTIDLFSRIEQLRPILNLDHPLVQIAGHLVSQAPWPTVQKELGLLHLYRAPMDMLACIVRVCKSLMDFLSMSQKPVGADDFFPALIYVIVQANPPDLQYSVEYIRAFAERRAIGQAAYWWTQFCTAVTFLSKLDKKGFMPPM
ncbi:hypothetical protein H696_00539 [Fonticula alba]|uniref:VPS9 domain-containing protein n=1 Tax=Fonticula alba TaxID=691883 RepID=A0A058ZHN2_FONAL|nr:hypothetical protein H696_00539 [Fonticula alba]KCV72987.1 hypothetical protein H696_00539 [Fonticula alba]|eukprot:XP_009492688.1 hypothetical protein H696_00539 [Fonticula alba]